MSGKGWVRAICGVGLAASIALGGCGAGDEEAEPAAPRKATPTAPELPPVAPPAAADAAAVTAEDADPARGATQYAMLCASCHGARGDADTPVAQTLDPKPARHSNGEYMNALSDEHLFRVIQQGGPAVGKSPLMAAWGGALSDAQIRDVIAFIRTLADPPYVPPAG